MNFSEVKLTVKDDVENVLSKKFGKKVLIHSISSLGGGCINKALKLNTNCGFFFLKWNYYCPSDIFLREAESLIELRKATKNVLYIPEVIAAKKVDKSPGFLVLEFLKAKAISSISDEILGRGLAIIHKYKGEKFGFYHNNYCGATLQSNSWKKRWIDFFRDNRLRFLLELIKNNRPLPFSEMKVYEKLMERLPDFLPENSTPVLIHGDLWSGNYMVTDKGPALIDPASYYADREMEMGIMTLFGGFSERFYKAYNEENPLPEGWYVRNCIYRLYHILNHYYLFGGGYRKQAFQIAKKFV